jgi:hypothetical protein
MAKLVFCCQCWIVFGNYQSCGQTLWSRWLECFAKSGDDNPPLIQDPLPTNLECAGMPAYLHIGSSKKHVSVLSWAPRNVFVKAVVMCTSETVGSNPTWQRTLGVLIPLYLD